MPPEINTSKRYESESRAVSKYENKNMHYFDESLIDDQLRKHKLDALTNVQLILYRPPNLKSRAVLPSLSGT